MTIVPASKLDAADPLARFRSRFVAADDPAVVAYLDGNSLGRPLAVTGERLASFVDGAWGRGLIRSWDAAWMAEPVTVGDRLAEVALGAAPGQVIVADSTTVLLYKLIRAGLSVRGDRDEVIIDRGNFPTDRFVVDGIAAEFGLTVRYLSAPHASGVRPEDVTAVLSERTALVVLSHIAYRSGFIADMAATTRAAHDAGALMLWDLCHSVGALPVELDACDVDLAAGCTYKYLNGGPGSPAFGYVSARLQEQLRQPIWGWMGASDPFAMGPQYEPAAGIRKFISGTPPVLAMQPLKDMLELIAEAGLDEVRRKSVALTEQAIALADELLVPLGATVASPRDPAERGSHVTVDHPLFAEVTAALWEQGVIPDFRPPDGIRIGLSPLSTSFAELERGVEAIARELRARTAA
ncbi:aminotransferase class V-fold PLP-dependent enzyme [Trebonia kvetii]|uniref:Kynureninase n=1 Tax=Trebonia kvetii TaxID=2480626 RepID=A0A6P2C8Q5_9ACTN|nr:aminotransferase class V-fold PLP-dependent enzyme [Trebonia kvetii]TVZ06895.1 aminotransferase class V-fold PLP-dependent enzyme [Trebonia kvetii]